MCDGCCHVFSKQVTLTTKKASLPFAAAFPVSTA